MIINMDDVSYQDDNGQRQRTRDACLLQLSVICLCTTTLVLLVLICGGGGGGVQVRHDTLELADAGCRCSSVASIGELVEPTFTVGAITPRIVQQPATANATVALGPGAGTGTGTNAPSISIDGSDLAGLITIKTGGTLTTANAAAKLLFSVTFVNPYPSTPSYIDIPSTSDYNAVRLSTTTTPYIYSKSRTGFLVYSNSAVLAANTIYKWSYLVVG